MICREGLLGRPIQLPEKGGEPVDIALPLTVGMWDKTEPVEVALVKGKNVLTFSRQHEGLKGVTIKDFSLTPILIGSGRAGRLLKSEGGRE